MFRNKMRRIRKRHGLLLVAVSTAVLTSGAIALTNSNTFGASQGGKAGDGTSPVSGYQIQTVSYQLNASDPTRIASWTITFQAGSTPSSVFSRALDGQATPQPVPAGSPWIQCSGTAGTVGPWTCTPVLATNQPPTASVMNVEVSAAE
jgi:hypothetical protein